MATREIDIKEAIVNIKIFGVGGGGNKVLERLAESQLFNIQLVAVNTDARQLKAVAAKGIDTLLIGEHLTNGLGTGGKAAVGQQAAIDAEEQLREAMYGADMVFITAGMGGGVGTGAAPVLSRIAREMNVLSVGIVTEPFSFEGKRKLSTAQLGIREMQAQMDALLVVKNDNLMKLQNNKKMSMAEAFRLADETLRQSISCIVEIIQTTGIINVDFADAVTIFRQGDSSDAVLGTGEAESAIEAVKAAINNPLVDKPIDGARGMIVNITSGSGIPMFDVGEATQFLYDNSHEDVNIIFGIVNDPAMGDRVRATIVATDFIDSVVFRVQQPVAPPNMTGNVMSNNAVSGVAPMQNVGIQEPVRREITLPDFMNRKF